MYSRTYKFLATLPPILWVSLFLLLPYLMMFLHSFWAVHDGVIAHAIASRDAINTGVRLGESSLDSAVGSGARPEQEFAGVASLRAFWSEDSFFFWRYRLAVIWLAHVQANR